MVKLSLPKDIFNFTLDNFISWEMYKIKTYLCQLMSDANLKTDYTPFYNLLFSSVRQDKLTVVEITADKDHNEIRKKVWEKYFPNSQIEVVNTVTEFNDINIINVKVDILLIDEVDVHQNTIDKTLKERGVCIIVNYRQHFNVNCNIDYAVKHNISLSTVFPEPQYKLVRREVNTPNLILIVKN